jgi:hypothetical protein
MNLEPITEEIRKQIARLNHALQVLEGVKRTKVKQARPRTKISAAGRKRIAAAQRARWKKIRVAKKKGNR